MAIKKYIILLTVLFAVPFLASCSLVPRDAGVAEKDTVASESGLYAEQFLPPDLDFVLAFNTHDKGQREIFEQIEGRLYLEFGVAYEMMSPAMNRLLGAKIDFINDFKPVIGENFRSVWGENGEDFYVIVTVADVAALDIFFGKLLSSEKFVESEYNERRLYENDADKIYILEYDDLLIFAGGRQKLIEAVDRHELRASTIENNPYFSKFNEKVGNDAFAYFFKKLSDKEFVSGAMNLQKDGIAMTGYTNRNYNPQKVGQFKLADNIFTDDIFGYWEGRDIASYLRAKLSEQAYGTYDSFKDSFESSTDLSFEKNLLSFLGEGYAFSFHDNGSLLPGVVMLFDASSDPKSASEVVESLRSRTETIVKSLQFSYEGGEEAAKAVASKRKLKIDGGEGYIMEIDFGLLLSSVSSEKFVFAFGMTGDNKFYLSTYKNFVESYGKRALTKNAEFMNLVDKIDTSDSSVLSYIAFKPFSGFFTRLYDYREDVEALIGENSLDLYDKYGNYLNPLKNGLFSVKKEGQEVFVNGFVNFD
ncbi:MAG: hypothetical protein ABH856_02880 [Patescibacteria group bacterium]|nr:hypothetical protein [Patescibacteria group bacterium]